MSNGLRDSLLTYSYLGNMSKSGDGENTFSVMPGDNRWSDPSLKLDSYWDEETQEFFLDQHGQPISAIYGKPKVCECGAVKTPNPNLHARYCPLFIDPSKGLK